MPDRDVKTIQDLIFYQYAKIIARRAFGVPDGKEAKKQHYGFVKQTFRELKSGVKPWSEITREDWPFDALRLLRTGKGLTNPRNKLRG